MKTRPELSAAIDRLADRVENGHLLASMGGEDLLVAASEKIADLEDSVAAGKRAAQACKELTQPMAWLAARIEHALTLMPSDAGAQWLVGWLLSQADMPQTRADQIMARCALSRHPEQEPAIPLCERCRHKATMHTVDGEERRECMEWQCSCEQYQHPIDEVPR